MTASIQAKIVKVCEARIASKGDDVVSFGSSLHDPDCYCLIRAFDSAKSMAAVLDAFYASSDWRSGPRGYWSISGRTT